jgi:hypothetical protein
MQPKEVTGITRPRDGDVFQGAARSDGDRELAAALTPAAAIIISHHQEADERVRLARQLVRSQVEREQEEPRG